MSRELGQALRPADGVAVGTRHSFLRDVRDLLALALPMFMGIASFAVMKATDSALVGHTGTRYLNAVALSDLWTASTAVLIQSRAVGVFCAQAYGAGRKHDVGVWLQVSYFVLFSMMVVVAVLWCLTGTVMRALGKSAQIAGDAQYFALVLALCLPVRIAFSQLGTFFTSQKIMRPTASCATAAMLTNLVLGCVLVLGVPPLRALKFDGWSGFGFHACPWVTTCVEYGQFAMMLLVFCYAKKLHRDCWPGWSRAYITKENLKKYMAQFVPQMLSSASDWWRLAALGAIASGLGDINLSVWNTSYRICWLVLIFSGSVAGSMGTQVGIALGAGEADRAKRQVLAGVVVCATVLVALCVLVVSAPRAFGSIFSNDPAVLGLFEESRWALAAFVGLMNLAVVLEKVPIAVGESKIAFRLGVVGSWVGQVPGALLCTRYWRDDMVGLFTGSALGYALLCVLLAVTITRLDFAEQVQRARHRATTSSAPPPPPRDEESPNREKEDGTRVAL
eukprot:CAMPEP_0176066710 /NCGR_PEP_ID=MMETSP0120_2-20121206/33293_1 /TAXON_ID=160619 /ORGANISM="Kryptoperidinium foliaceum, Strain CCMP 1326" /LENGTH=505 /DNA_ID=CAMNT_0017400319 /DNA_START=71 /DNA_END=1588 /DNA_ORIENTATION=-